MGVIWSRPADLPALPAPETVIDQLSKISVSKPNVSENDNFDQYMASIRERRHDAISSIKTELDRLRACKEELDMVNKEKIGLEQQVKALKKVASISNDMLKIREAQVTDLKKRLQDMESHADECLTDLRVEYQKQIDNIKNLRQLYEERATAAAAGHEQEISRERAKNTALEAQLAEELNSKQGMNDFIAKLESEVQGKQTEYEQMKAKYMTTSADRMSLASQMSLVNNLFSTLLSGDEGPDFDRFARMLENNRELISDLTFNGDINETASILMDIAGDTLKRSEQTEYTSNREKIASNLPKVWRILVELLSHYDEKTSNDSKPEDIIEFRVASVSRTFLKLKDLILEKNSLVKDISRLKTLNNHLESRLDHQQERLNTVTTELNKAWNAVSKLNAQHKKLHTHEQILRYELQHKRNVLTELKQELEYCKQKWDQARVKNTQTEHDWQILREEFAHRKYSMSIESGFDEDDDSRMAVADNSCSSDDDESWLKSLSMDTNTDLDPADDNQSSQKPSGLKKLEEQNRSLLNQMVRTCQTSDSINERLNELHRRYGRSSLQVSLETEETLETDIQTEAIGTNTSDNNIQSNTKNNIESDIDRPNSENRLQECTNITKVNTLDSLSPNTQIERVEIQQTDTNVLRPDETDRLQRRAARLKRLEEQCLGLFRQVSKTNARSDEISERLDEVHTRQVARTVDRQTLNGQTISTEEETLEQEQHQES
ncbi:myosin-J heavy chain [Daktulosphaira vitifoliae]|uniref:myosin-J heavy chain n=1 Tax=Daktulosphaira vitifoliae TaxID=58002 RepID=UPI0021AB01A2|nr:myosin-J heavy chain [Daktulosphaira vitifoliae]XP_050543196.1 myosin-J heavy chain [Daktulosphaira vitifoliae]